MNFDAVKGLTIPAPKVVVEETTETSITYYLEYGEEENAKLIEGNNYLVTVDGAKYSCTAFFDSNNDAVALGDSEYEDTPFYIMNYVYNTTLTGEDYELYIQYPDSDTHTIEIAEVVEKAVTQITDASGRVIWAVESSKPVVLEVEKITSNTYVSSTSYTNEQFLMLDIYPKTAGSTVNVTYGDLTKTLSFTSTSAKQVYFGTYGGVADSVATPTSGELTIEGDCVGVAVSSYNSAKSTTTYCYCITAVNDWGGINIIPDNAFYDCYCQHEKFTLAPLPNGLTSIGYAAFYQYRPDIDEGDTLLDSITIPSSVTSIDKMSFSYQYGKDDNPLYYSIVANVYMTSAIPPALGKHAFGCYYYGDPDTILYNCNVRIYVPRGSGDAYKTAEGWSFYAEYITEVS